MLCACLSVIVIVAALAAPRPVRVRIRLTTPDSTSVSRTRVLNALHLGLYKDSLITETPRSDTVGRRPFDQTVVLEVSIASNGARSRLCTVVKNVLAREIIGPDTVSFLAADLDSVLTATGTRYARLLSQPQTALTMSHERCT